MLEYHCPKCGEVCRELIFDFRDRIVACDVCEKRQTRFKLEEEHQECLKSQSRRTELS